MAPVNSPADSIELVVEDLAPQSQNKEGTYSSVLRSGLPFSSLVDALKGCRSQGYPIQQAPGREPLVVHFSIYLLEAWSGGIYFQL